MKKLLFLLISLPGFVFGTIGDSKEEFEKKYGKPTKVMSNGQVMLYKKDNVKYMAMFHENKSVIFEVDYGRKLKDKEVLDLASKAFPGVKLDWIQGEDCWRDKKKACVIRYTQGNKLAFIDAVNDYKRLKANRKKMK